MGLENAEFVAGLVDIWPVTATDPVTEGSNHLQLIKKVLQQTFPNYDSPVLYTPDELNEATLNNVDEEIFNTWLFDLGLAIGNDSAVIGIDSLASAQNLVGITAADQVDIGSANLDAAVQALALFGVAVGGASVAEFKAFAAGGLAAADSAGALSEVAKLGAAQTISAQWLHTDSLRLANSIGLEGLDSGATPQTLIRMENDRTDIGNPNTTLRQRALDSQSFQISGNQVAVFVVANSGSLLVNDRSSVQKKVAFRNPGFNTQNGNYTFLQDDEGQTVYKSATSAQTYTAPSLEAGTSITFVNASQAQQTINQSGVTILALLGDDSLSSPILFAPSSVCQLYWLTTATCLIWGNGLS